MAERDDQAYLKYRGQDLYNSGSGGQDYGWRILRGEKDYHTGIDFGVSGRTGVPIGVPEIFDGWTCHKVYTNGRDGLGNQVILISPDGKKMAKFGHIANNSIDHLKDGQVVHTGDWIGDVGGTSMGQSKDEWRPHIHFEYGYNPKYQHVVRAYDTKKEVEFDCDYHQWVFGDETNKDRINPEKVLTEDMVERATQMAIDSKKAHLTGNAPKREMASTNLKREGGSGGSFGDWFKTTWLGRLFFGNDSQAKPAQQEEPLIHRTEAGTTIHRAGYQNTNTKNPQVKLSCISQEQYQDMVKNGFPVESIMKLDKIIQSQIKRKSPGLVGALNQVAINCTEVFSDDPKMARKMQNYLRSSNFSVRR